MTDFNLQFAVVGDGLVHSDSAVPVREGLNVVYGLNGAGKTRFLTGVRNAIQGVGGLGIALLVRLPSTVDDQLGRPHDAATSVPTFHQTVPLAAIAKSLATINDFHYLGPGERRLLERTANGVIERYLSALVPPSGPIREWALRNPLFLLIPTGQPNAPAWECWAVADPAADWVQAEAAEVEQLWQKYDAEYVYIDEDEDGHEAHEEWFRDATRSLTLLPEEEGQEFRDLRPFRRLSYGMATSPDPITVVGPIDFGVDLASDEETADGATARYLRIQLGSDDNSMEDGVEEPGTEEVASIAAVALAEAVTRRLQRALIDAPTAQLDLATPSARLFDPPFVWTFSREWRGAPRVPLTALSRAERLWAERSIVESAAELSQRGARRPSLYLYDEPESALHRAAETYMATSLVERAKLPGVTILAATHSPELLDSAGANLLEVKRTDRKSLLQTLDAVSRSNLEELGLNPSDLLRLTRVYLAVEGHHDEVLINHFLGKRLRRARVEILPLHGGKRLPHTIDSRVLFDHTNAHLVGLLDNADASHLMEAWSAAQELAATGHVVEAKDLILHQIGKDRGETQYMSAWLTRALDRGLQSRLTPMALSKADIIEYLPVAAFVAGASSWEGLREEHAGALATKAGTPRDFKKWMTVRYKVSFGTEELLRIASGVAVPKDFELLAKTVEAIASDRENTTA